jgi:hypothetical protein
MDFYLIFYKNLKKQGMTMETIIITICKIDISSGVTEKKSRVNNIIYLLLPKP